MFFKIGVLENFANFTGKHLCWSLLLIKSQAKGPATLLKRNDPTQMFSCEICENFKNTFFTEHLQWLLLKNGSQRKCEIFPVYMAKVTGLQRKKSEKERMAWSGEYLRLRRRYINQIIKAIKTG